MLMLAEASRFVCFFLIWTRIKGIQDSVNTEGKGFFIVWCTIVWVVFAPVFYKHIAKDMAFLQLYH